MTFALSLSAAFAVSRIIEQNLLTVDLGHRGGARAPRPGPISTLRTFLVIEPLGPLVLGYTFIFAAVVVRSDEAGIFGGGGLGDFAISF